MRRHFNLLLVATLAILTACQSGRDDETLVERSKPLQFSSSVENHVYTRAYGSTWEEGDLIGVYMKKKDQTISDENIVEGVKNYPFVTREGDGNFVSSKEPKAYPEDGSEVDFIAYYPYNEALAGTTLKLDVSDQTKQNKIDLLYSNNLKARSKASVQGNLQFVHKLAHLTINLTSPNASNISDVKIYINSVKTKADFDLAANTLTVDDTSTKKVELKKEGNSATAILLPATDISAVKLIVELGNEQKEVSLPSNITSFEGGKRYVFKINISKSGQVIDPEAEGYIRWRETPVITKDQLKSSHLYYINHKFQEMTDPVTKGKMRNYSLLYDSKLKFSYWVAYPLFQKAITKVVDRTDRWGIYDPGVSSSLQVNLKSGYGSGYDRGHQLPSADRVSEIFANESTFYPTNMTPQVGTKLNQSIWQELEKQVRSWVSGTDTVFVVTGAIPPKNESDYERIKNTVKPAYYFKALARKVGGVFYTIGFKLENRPYEGRNFWQGVMSVEDLERETGFTFFPSLEAGAKKLDRSKWQ